MKAEPCCACGGSFPDVFPPPRHSINGVLFCDSCANKRMAETTGFPCLPEAPAPETFVGPDGKDHLLCYQFFRCPTGILAVAEEFTPQGEALPQGFRYEVFGEGHDADLRPLVAELRQRATQGIARAYLSDHSGRLLLEGTEVEGRLVWDDDRELQSGLPYAVAVDGKLLTWEEFGRTLEAYEGWRFKLSILEPHELPSRDGPSDWWEDLDWTRKEG